MFELNWLLIPTFMRPNFFFYLFGKGDFKSNHPVIIFVFSKYLVRKPSFIRVEISWKCTMVVYRKSLQQIELGLRHIFT